MAAFLNESASIGGSLICLVKDREDGAILQISLDGAIGRRHNQFMKI
jgi:hypothetical protein